MTLNDLESQNSEFLVNFWRFHAVTDISGVNSVEIAGDRPKQPEYEIFSVKPRS